MAEPFPIFSGVIKRKLYSGGNEQFLLCRANSQFAVFEKKDFIHDAQPTMIILVENKIWLLSMQSFRLLRCRFAAQEYTGRAMGPMSKSDVIHKTGSAKRIAILPEEDQSPQKRTKFGEVQPCGF